MKITRFEDIEAWKKARILMNKVYRTVKVPAFDEDREMRRQMRRAALSVMSNIAEGFDGGSDPEFRRFLRIAKRSSSELQSHFYAAVDQGYIPQSVFTDCMSVRRRFTASSEDSSGI